MLLMLQFEPDKLVFQILWEDTYKLFVLAGLLWYFNTHAQIKHLKNITNNKTRSTLLLPLAKINVFIIFQRIGTFERKEM